MALGNQDPNTRTALHVCVEAEGRMTHDHDDVGLRQSFDQRDWTFGQKTKGEFSTVSTAKSFRKEVN
jgi:hypothetical protein